MTRPFFALSKCQNYPFKRQTVAIKADKALPSCRRDKGHSHLCECGASRNGRFGSHRCRERSWHRQSPKAPCTGGTPWGPQCFHPTQAAFPQAYDFIYASLICLALCCWLRLKVILFADKWTFVSVSDHVHSKDKHFGVWLSLSLNYKKFSIAWWNIYDIYCHHPY